MILDLVIEQKLHLNSKLYFYLVDCQIATSNSIVLANLQQSSKKFILTF